MGFLLKTKPRVVMAGRMHQFAPCENDGVSALMGFGGVLEFPTFAAAQKFLDKLEDAGRLFGLEAAIEEVKDARPKNVVAFKRSAKFKKKRNAARSCRTHLT